MRHAALSILFAALLPVMNAHADVPAYKLVPTKSILKFFAIQNAAPVEGRFSRFTADIRFDADQLDKSGIEVMVDTGSVQTAHDDVASNLKLPEWLAVEMFPEAKFVSRTISRTPLTDNYFAEGDLTLRGITVPVTVNFQLEHTDETVAVAKGYATLHRRDFKVGQGQWASDDVIKDEVRVEFRIVAVKQ